METHSGGTGRRGIVLLLAAVSVVGGCGTSTGSSPTNDGSGPSSMVTDSRPGETPNNPATDNAGDGAGDPDTGPGSAAGNGAAIGSDDDATATSAVARVTPGAAVLAAEGFSDFSGRRVGLIASRASVVGDRSIIDVMAEADAVDLVAVFAAEHGIRAEAEAGVSIADETDPVTGLPVFSLYGSTRKPTPEMLAGVEVLFFDLQDVGTRFYTYTATMGLAMQAAAEADIPFVVLDRPNPLGGTIAGGALRDDDEVSFVSLYPIPSVHAMTAGELALAIKGEEWLDGLTGLDLRVVPLDGWRRDQWWSDTGLTWIPPSPGLPSAEAALVYPATVLLEGTTLSFGRGTDHPFQLFGAPWLDGALVAAALNARGLPGVRFEPVEFTPAVDEANEAPANDAQQALSDDAPADVVQHEGVSLRGVRIEVTDPMAIEPASLGVYLLTEILAQAVSVPVADGSEPVTVIDRPRFFDLLAGTPETRLALEQGVDPAAIIAAWDEDLVAFELIRDRYLLY